jgi:hypothetical protein
MKVRMQLSQLRSQHPRLYYRSFTSQVTEEGLEIGFLFQTEPDISFHPKLVIEGVTSSQVAKLAPGELDQYVFHIGLVEMLSYWKATCSPQIVIEAGALSAEQINWWHDLLIQGLGEFFFVNQIDFTQPEFVTITSTGSTQGVPQEQKSTPQEDLSQTQSFLIPIGGGKDSAVTLEILKEYQALHPDQVGQTAGFMINPTPASRQMAEASGLTQTLTVRRQLDPLLLELNGQGYLNGHTPFSALVAFTSLLTARLFGYQLVAVSNEASSNEGNVEFHGHEINHQYSKTYEFEKKLKTYTQTYLSSDNPDVEGYYFSLMRPLFELQIARLFAGYPHYHSVFRSCNRGQKTNSWCGECPKCLFAYVILYPFLGKETMVKIFGQDLFAKAELLPIALELLGYAEKKPLECVGTREENISAFYLSYDRAQAEYDQLPSLLELVQVQVLAHELNLESRSQAILSSWNSQHFIPLRLEKFLKTKVG